MENTALLIIDIQNDYFPGGKLALDKPQIAANNTARLLDYFRVNGLPLVHIQHENLNPDLPFMLPDSEGQKIHPSVRPDQGETLITKHYPNAFWSTNLEQHLKTQRIENLVIAGMMTHMCVSSTTRAAMERGFNVSLIADACATRSLEFNGQLIPAETVHQTALAELTLIARIESLESFLNRQAIAA
ncbi:MAG: cysteine hydrolase [Gammaproteobacteria bacterium]|nr:cysteine hydrolase [Gammaproteobacteria bacterium]